MLPELTSHPTLYIQKADPRCTLAPICLHPKPLHTSNYTHTHPPTYLPPLSLRNTKKQYTPAHTTLSRMLTLFSLSLTYINIYL